MQRLSLILSATALVVALLGATPVGEAAREVAAQVPPLAKRATFAKTAGVANNAKRLGGRPASAYARLGRDGKLLPSLGAVGPQGPQGPKGDPGARGEQGPRGPAGAGAAFTIKGPGNSNLTSTTTFTTVLTLQLPAGRYVILGRAHIGQGGAAQYSGFCQVVAGNQSDVSGVQGVRNPTIGGVGDGSNVFVSVIQEFDTASAATLQCWSPAGAPTTYSSPQLTAIEIAGN